MDFTSIDGRRDFFLLQLHNDRIKRMQGIAGMTLAEFSLHLQLACGGEPNISSDAFLIDLVDAGYIEPGKFGDGKVFELTKAGSEFIGNGGYTEQERKRLVDLKKDEKVDHDLKSIKRINTWFYPLLAGSLILNGLLIATNAISIYKLQSPQYSPKKRSGVDSSYAYRQSVQKPDSTHKHR